MKTNPIITLKSVQSVYSGPEGDLWELVMGEQIHVGGFQSSMDLAEKAAIGAGLHGRSLLLQWRRDAISCPFSERFVHGGSRCNSLHGGTGKTTLYTGWNGRSN